MNQNKKPSPATRLISHALVGLLCGYVISQMTKRSAFPVAALLTACAHEALDAPVAYALTDLGA
jgi:hypothetical protein